MIWWMTLMLVPAAFCVGYRAGQGFRDDQFQKVLDFALQVKREDPMKSMTMDPNHDRP
jgi:hypothetical protein